MSDKEQDNTHDTQRPGLHILERNDGMIETVTVRA